MATGWGWARWKSGARSSIWISYLCSRGSSTWAILCRFPRCVSWKMLGAEQPGLEQALPCGMLVLQAVA